jgi:RNA recognition motif-containing protein
LFTDVHIEGESVYVGNIPSSISEADLENEFSRFGRLIPDGVAIRSRKVVANLSFDSPLSITQVNLLIDLVLHPNYGHILSHEFDNFLFNSMAKYGTTGTINCHMNLTIFFFNSIAKYNDN